MRLLVIEDDPTIAGFVRQGLTELGYVVDVAAEGRDAERMAAGGPYDVVILDVMLPGPSGIEVCKNLRRRGVGDVAGWFFSAAAYSGAAVLVSIVRSAAPGGPPPAAQRGGCKNCAK